MFGTHNSPLLRGCDESAAAAAVVLKGERQEVSEEEEEEDEAPQHAELSSSSHDLSHDLSSGHGRTTGTIAALPDVGDAAPATPRRADLNSERDDALEERLERVRCEVAALRRELLGPARREHAAAAAARDSLWECAMAKAEARQ